VAARQTVDFAELRRRLGGRCFICELLAGNPDYAHEVVFEDVRSVAFLNRYPALLGHTLVAPKEHREHVTGDFTLDEYLELQRVVHRVGDALRATLPTERLYVLSLGSQAGNRHVHWHLAPLPPGVPFEEQQLRALDRADCLDLRADEISDLARRLWAAVAG
jgi:diadenosine tetraphosphate (Ap4A) HIT family hydrolase